RAVLAQVVVRPREESVGLVVRLVERHGLEQSVAGCLVIAGLVENATLAEEGLGLHAAPEAAQRALGGRQGRQDEQQQRQQRCALRWTVATGAGHPWSPGGLPLPLQPRARPRRGPTRGRRRALPRDARRALTGWPRASPHVRPPPRCWRRGRRRARRPRTRWRLRSRARP